MMIVNRGMHTTPISTAQGNRMIHKKKFRVTRCSSGLQGKPGDPLQSGCLEHTAGEDHRSALISSSGMVIFSLRLLETLPNRILPGRL